MKFDTTSLPPSDRTTGTSGPISQGGSTQQALVNGVTSATSALVTAHADNGPETASLVINAKLLKQLIAPEQTSQGPTASAGKPSDTGSTTLLAKVLTSTATTLDKSAGAIPKLIAVLTTKADGTFTAPPQTPPSKVTAEVKQQTQLATHETDSPALLTSRKAPITVWSNHLRLLPTSGPSIVSRPTDVTVISDKPLSARSLLTVSVTPPSTDLIDSDAAIALTAKTVIEARLAGSKTQITFTQPLTKIGTLIAEVTSAKFVPDNATGGDKHINSKPNPPSTGPSGQLPHSTKTGNVTGIKISDLPTLSLIEAPPRIVKSQAYAASADQNRGELTNTTRQQDHSGARGRWLLTLTPLTPFNSSADQPKVQVITPTYVPTETVLAITTTNTQEKPPFNTLLRELTTIIREGLNTAQLEARPITDLSKLTQALDASKQATQTIDQSTIEKIRGLSEFGIHKDSNFKQLLNSVGVFSSRTEGQTTANNTAGAQNDRLQTSVMRSAISEPKEVRALDQNTRDETPGTTLKDEIISLLVRLNVESTLKPQDGGNLLGSKDPFILLMDLLNRPIGAGAANRQDGGNQDSQRARVLVANVLKQVLLGIQGAGLKSLAEQNQIKDTDSQNTQLLSIELPIHWSNSIGKTLFKLFHREHWQDGENNEEPVKIKSWQFELTMDFPGDRILTTRCTLDEQQVRIQFWANQDGFKKVVEKRMQRLKKDMENDGINLDYCGCALGLAPDQAKANYFRQLIDTKA